MQSFCFTTFIFLWVCSFFLSVHSIKCNATQYSWPNGNPQFCCNMCEPGQFMAGRDEKTCDIRCRFCPDKYYTDTYNIDMCKICNDCNRVNMVYVSHCTRTQNAVCRCKAGYRCIDEACSHCLVVPTSLPPSTTTSTLKPLILPTLRAEPIKDTMWFLVIIALLCVGIALVVVTKIKPIANWFNLKKGYSLAEKPGVPAPAYTEEEDVCQPIQEMCGKCDQPIDV